MSAAGDRAASWTRSSAFPSRRRAGRPAHVELRREGHGLAGAISRIAISRGTHILASACVRVPGSPPLGRPLQPRKKGNDTYARHATAASRGGVGLVPAIGHPRRVYDLSRCRSEPAVARAGVSSRRGRHAAMRERCRRRDTALPKTMQDQDPSSQRSPQAERDGRAWLHGDPVLVLPGLAKVRSRPSAFPPVRTGRPVRSSSRRLRVWDRSRPPCSASADRRIGPAPHR